MTIDTNVLLVGCGSLGSRTAQLLLAGGVRRITLCDPDIIVERNLGNTAYPLEDVGRRKVDSLKDILLRQFPDANITTVAAPFSRDTPLGGIMIIVEATDSLAARHLLNDRALQARVPLVIGTASKETGMVFAVYGSPCWQCVMKGKAAVDGCEDIPARTLDATAKAHADAALHAMQGVRVQALCVVDAKDDSRKKVSVARNPSFDACNGTYAHLDAPYMVEHCGVRDRIVSRPTTAITLDLASISVERTVLRRYASALLLALGSGTVLVHRHGLLEFDGVTEDDARAFAARVL
jgi:molybdopterin/thiamine biosynthesis adenylyltransferase